MNIHGLIGKKIDQSQAFLEDGRRVPMSRIWVDSNLVSQIKTQDHEGYNAVQLATETKKRTTKAIAGHAKKAGITNTPRFFREIRLTDAADVEVGSAIRASDVFKPGDIIDVSGVSKGKGFAGGVKRHHFRGGPRTHGQSDRERAPGSIGQTTTPGRVYKGKRMAGHMGVDHVTVKNLMVLDATEDTLLVMGLIPGVKGAQILIKKVKETKRSIKSSKKYVPLYKKQSEIPVEVVEAPAEEEKSEQEMAATEIPAEEAIVTEAPVAEEVKSNEEASTEGKEPEAVESVEESKDAK